MVKARASNKIFSPYDHWEPLSDAEFYKAMEDFVAFCENSIVIDKNGRPVKFKLNEAQKIFAETTLKAIYPMLHKKPMGRVRVMCHKSRQMGITTVCLKLEQFILTKLQNMNALHIMPTESEAMEMVDRKFLPLVQGTNPDLMATMNLSGNRVDFIDLDEQILDNRLSFMSAGTRGAMHGRTLQILLFDEYAKYVDPFTLETGVLPALSGDTVQLVLFTAKGMNHAYDLSKVAQDPNSDWVYIFLPWYVLSEYERTPEGQYKELTNLSEYDVFLCKEFEKAGIPIDKWARKLQWYEYTFINEAKRDKKYMNENYPSVASESFEASGAPIFDSTLLYKWMEEKHKTLDVFYRDGETVFDYIEGGSIREWEPPRRGADYVIGLDPADGEVAGDDSALSVWDVSQNREKMKCVAAYNGTISQNDFAELAYDIAMRYNQALLVPERNMGQLMIKWLTEVKGYFNIWTDVDKLTSYNNLGVRTTVPSKNEMVARLKFLMNNNYLEIYDPVFCEQGLYFTFQKTQGGQFRAAGDAGHHDDQVLANMLITMSLDMSRFKGYAESMTQKEGRKYT